MKQLQSGAKALHIVDDKNGTPTYTHDFANNVKVLLEHEYWGLYNMVCEGQTSRFEVAEEIVSILKLADKIKIIPVSSDHFKAEYYADRPPSERLVNQKLILRNLNIMRNWKTSLKEYLENDFIELLK